MSKNIKLFITDIDGVWTDGGMYYDEKGNEFKKFNTADSAGVLFCRLLDIEVAIMTGENVNSVKRRAEKLKIKHYFPAAKNKLTLAKNLCKELNITLEEVAFIGDDINDILLLKEVGYSGSPQNAPDYVKKYAKVITKKSGGEGAFREFVETWLKQENLLDVALEKYFEKLQFNQ